MRRTYNAEFLRGANGEIYGINLGADHCAEHEFGIKGIETFFRIDKTKMGMDKYRVNDIPAYPYANGTLEKVAFTECHMPWVGLFFTSKRLYGDIPMKKRCPHPLKYEEDEISAAWDENGFAIVVHKKYRTIIDEIMNAILEHDMAIGLGCYSAFRNGGLKLMILSKTPQELNDAQMEVDVDAENLAKAVKKTRIERYLKWHGKEYRVLKPRWFDGHFETGDRKLESKYNVIFWLDPRDQTKYKYGWYTVEDLKLWGKDKGVVLK